MAKYISLDALYSALDFIEENAVKGEEQNVRCITNAIKAIKFVPADVAEVRHGRWIKVDDNPYEYVAACSVCRNELKQPTCMLKPIYSYCPICGARMQPKVDADA